jgi:hypothetical protein
MKRFIDDYGLIKKPAARSTLTYATRLALTANVTLPVSDEDAFQGSAALAHDPI